MARDDDNSSRIKPPPNYGSRAVQTKLLMLVFTFGLVLVLMNKAKDPRMYAWMGFEQQEGADQAVDESNGAAPETRLAPRSPERAGPDDHHSRIAVREIRLRLRCPA